MKALIAMLMFTLGMGTTTFLFNHASPKIPVSALLVFGCQDVFDGVVIINRDGSQVAIDARNRALPDVMKHIQPLIDADHAGSVTPNCEISEPIPHDFPGDPSESHTDKTTT